MATFTTITADMDYQTAALWNELAYSFYERLSAVRMGSSYHPASIALASVGDNLQSRARYYDMQGWMESIISGTAWTGRWAYYDDSVDLTAETSLTPYTLAEWRVRSGMHVDGFRRASTWYPDTDDWTDPSDPMWARAENGHGKAQHLDIIGPWIYDDLQKGLNAMNRLMEWSSSFPSSTQISKHISYYKFYTNPTCATLLAAEASDWAADYPPAPVTPGGRIYTVAREAQSFGSSPFNAGGVRREGSWPGTTFYAIPTKEVVATPLAMTTWSIWALCEDPSHFISGAVWNDLDGLGLTEGFMNEMQTGGPEVPGAFQTSTQIGASLTNPWSIAPAITCPFPATAIAEGVRATEFTYTVGYTWSYTL